MTTKDTASRPHRGDLEWMPGTQNGFIFCVSIRLLKAPLENMKMFTLHPARTIINPSKPRLWVMLVTAPRQSPWMFYVVISLRVGGGGASLARAQCGCREEAPHR